MEYVVGVLLGFTAPLFARAVGFDRVRSLYTVVLVVTASYYDLFAVLGGSTHALLSELVATVAFTILSAVGFRLNLWLVVVGLVAHGIFDIVHRGLFEDPCWHRRGYMQDLVSRTPFSVAAPAVAM